MIDAGNGKVWKKQAKIGIILLGIMSSRSAGNEGCGSRMFEVCKDPMKEKL